MWELLYWRKGHCLSFPCRSGQLCSAIQSSLQSLISLIWCVGFCSSGDFRGADVSAGHLTSQVACWCERLLWTARVLPYFAGDSQMAALPCTLCVVIYKEVRWQLSPGCTLCIVCVVTCQCPENDDSQLRVSYVYIILEYFWSKMKVLAMSPFAD